MSTNTSTRSLGAAQKDAEVAKWEQREEIIAATTTAALTAAYMFKATRAAKRGEWNKAIFYAILWVGTGNNAAHAQAARRNRRANSKRDNYYSSLFS